MTGPLLALGCFCALLAWASVERRAAQREEFVRSLDDLRPTAALGLLALVGGRARPNLSAIAAG